MAIWSLMLNILVTGALLSNASCSGGTFADEPTSPVKIREPLTLTSPLGCHGDNWRQDFLDGSVTPENREGEHHLEPNVLQADPKLSLKVTGKFCPPPSLGDGRILFTIDVSGSMSDTDLRSGDSCGRLDAVKAVIDQASNSQNIEAAAVLFHNSVVQTASFTDLATFRSQYLKPEVFCTFYTEKSSKSNLPGYTETKTAGTDYKKALEKVSELLATVKDGPEKKVVYFLSDGKPDTGDEGQQIAETIRQDVPDLIFNGLLFGNSVQSDSNEFNALKTLAGNTDRVKLLANASALEGAIVGFPAGIKPETKAASLTFTGQSQPQAIPFKSLSQIAGSRNEWQFELMPFQLEGDPGATNDITLTISSEGTNGESYKSILTIKYARP